MSDRRLRQQFRDFAEAPTVLSIFRGLARAHADELKTPIRSERSPYLDAADWIAERAGMSRALLGRLAERIGSHAGIGLPFGPLPQMSDEEKKRAAAEPRPLHPLDEAHATLSAFDTPAAAAELAALLIDRYPHLGEPIPSAPSLDVTRARVGEAVAQLRRLGGAGGPLLQFVGTRMHAEAWEDWQILGSVAEHLAGEIGWHVSAGYDKDPARIIVGEQEATIATYERIVRDANVALAAAGLDYLSDDGDPSVIDGGTAAAHAVEALPDDAVALEVVTPRLDFSHNIDGGEVIYASVLGALDWTEHWSRREPSPAEADRRAWQAIVRAHAMAARFELYHVENLWRVTATALEALLPAGETAVERPKGRQRAPRQSQDDQVIILRHVLASRKFDTEGAIAKACQWPPSKLSRLKKESDKAANLIRDHLRGSTGGSILRPEADVAPGTLRRRRGQDQARRDD